MLTRAETRKGRCPGVLAPMQAKDGLIVRLRISGQRLDAKTARAIAGAARKFGDGACELTSRANLQLRGVAPGNAPALVDLLYSLGLIDESAEAEQVRNVLISPLAGLCGGVDAAALGADLEAALVGAPDLRRLPAKFGFLIDDGGAVSLKDEAADARFVFDAARGDFSVAIGGRESEATGLGACAPRDVVATALRIARAFLAASETMQSAPRRLSEIIEAGGAPMIASAAALAPAAAAQRSASPPPIGLFTTEGLVCFAAAAPFGRLSAEMIEAFADAVETFGRGEIRLTPWRALIAPGARLADGEKLSWRLRQAGFIIRPDDARLAISACVGEAGCERGSTQTRRDALSLASIARRLAPAGAALHVSGCAKGCARPRATPLTLVGHDGLYDFILDGAPFDRATRTNLSLTAARDLLHAMADAGESAAGGRK